MWEEIFKYFKTNPEWSLAITILSTFTVWLYKEFKVMIAADNKNKLSLIQKKMDLYSGVEAATARVIWFDAVFSYRFSMARKQIKSQRLIQTTSNYLHNIISCLVIFKLDIDLSSACYPSCCIHFIC